MADHADRLLAQIRADGHEAHGTVLDVARPEQIESFVAAVQARHGRLSVLVNSAGVVTVTDPAAEKKGGGSSEPMK